MPASVPDHPAVNEAMQYCSACGKTVTSAIPDGDNRLRAICTACGTVHYQNPKIVAGCVPEHEGQILLCRRAIEPRCGFWTVPAGFMELGETLAEAALRETWEEALARVEIGPLFAAVDVIHAGQVHVFFSGVLARPEFGAGAETIETRLFLPADIPWSELAFPSIRIALERYLEIRRTGNQLVYLASAPRSIRG
jgi:ADP-ribose pyrophosphatase YjhB (NUDIX family)